jgi:hypothetical protein
MDAVLGGERLERLGRIEGLVEADADDVEAIGTEHRHGILDGFLQVLGGGRADLEAGGVDEAHQQRLAPVVGQARRSALAVEQDMIADVFAEGILRKLVGGLVVERGQRQPAAVALRHLDQAGRGGGRRHGRRIRRGAGADFCSDGERDGEHKRRKCGGK